MYPVPVTYLYQFEGCTEEQRRGVMREFAANGAKHLALTDTLISDMLKKNSLIDQYLKEVKEEGLSYLDAHAMFSPDMDLNCPNQAKRGMMLARHKLQLEILAYMGIETFTIHVGNNLQYEPMEKLMEFNYNMICEALAELLPLAEKLGIIINIENIWFPTNTPEFLLKIKENFPTDHLGFCYDAGHANLMKNGKLYTESNPHIVWKQIGMEPQWDDEILQKMLPHVVSCHIHDNIGQYDYHQNIGNGNINWQEIAGLLKQAPRLKVIQSEVLPFHAKVSIRELCESFQKLFPETKEL